jgi:hypothetical protein
MEEEAKLMRATVTIDPDVEALLQAAASEQQKTLDEVLNHALRQALARQAKPGRKPYRVQPRSLGIRAGVNLDKALRLADELEDEEIMRKLREGR